jgi:hypothetical protein
MNESGEQPDFLKRFFHTPEDWILHEANQRGGSLETLENCLRARYDPGPYIAEHALYSSGKTALEHVAERAMMSGDLAGALWAVSQMKHEKMLVRKYQLHHVRIAAEIEEDHIIQVLSESLARLWHFELPISPEEALDYEVQLVHTIESRKLASRPKQLERKPRSSEPGTR